MKKTYRLKNKTRFFSIIFTLTFILLTALFATNAYGYKEPSYKEVTVLKGDSLWTIAQKYGDTKDIRKYIYNIKKINNLDSSEIFEGAQLKIPA